MRNKRAVAAGSVLVVVGISALAMTEHPYAALTLVGSGCLMALMFAATVDP